MRRRLSSLPVLLRAVGLLVGCLAAARVPALDPDDGLAQDRGPVNGTIVGATATGSLALVINGVTEAVRREFPGSALAYELSSTPGAVLAVGRGRSDLGLGGTIDLTMAHRGEPPFPQPLAPERFTVVARLLDDMMSYVAVDGDFADRHQLYEFADLARRQPPLRISVYGPANLSVYRQAVAYFDAIGIGEADFARWGGAALYLPTSPSLLQLKDRRMDAVFAMGFQPDGRLIEVMTGRDIRLLRFDSAEVGRVAAALDIDTGVIPGGTYVGVAEDLPTTSMGILLVAGPAAPEVLTYKIARALHRHFDYYRSVHAAFAGFEPAMLARAGTYELHPGAARYYRTVGLAP